MNDLRVEFHPTLSLFMVGIGYVAGHCISFQFPGFAILVKWG